MKLASASVLKYRAIRPEIQIDWLTRRALLIIDEARGSYTCLSLWNDFIKYFGARDPPMVILFSSWGSATSRSGAVSTTPIHLTDAQRISIRPSHNSNPFVFFTYTEFIDVIERAKKCESQHGQALPDRDVINYIWAVTNGYPGAVREILAMLARSEVSISTDIYTIFKLTCIPRPRIYVPFVREAPLSHSMSLY